MGHPDTAQRLGAAFCLALGAACGLASPTPAHAQAAARAEAARPYDIAAGPLARALSAWGAQSDRQLVFPPDLVAGKTSRRVSGRYTAGEVLDRLLDGTGIAWEALGDSTIVLKRAPAKTPKPAPAARAVRPREPRTETLDRLVVTGSHLPRADLETASPVQVITRRDLERSGKATVADYLQTLTADGQGSIPKTFGSGFAAGSTAVSLRGLGASSTLILLNGRRMASFGLADDGQRVFTDLSTIPMDAVERIDVLKDGASAIYGSDAIAGVINILLRKDFTGLTATGQYGVSGSGDGAQRRGSIVAGWGDLARDGYNVLLDIEGLRSDRVGVDDRRDRRWIGTGDLRPWGYSLDASPSLRGAITSFDATRNSASASLTGAVENPFTGLWESLPGCDRFPVVAPADPNGGCLWDVAPFVDLVPKESTLNLFSRATFAVSDASELYAEFNFSRKQSEFRTSPTSVSGAWGYPGGLVNASSGPGAIVLGAAHPDNPYDVPVRLRYAAFDVGSRRRRSENDFTRLLIGTRGSARGWDYDAAYLHSQTRLSGTDTGYLQYDRVRQVLTDPDSPVGYWRIGANAGLNSRALYDYIAPAIARSAGTRMDIVDAKASRSLRELRGGALGLAVGGEFRRQYVELAPPAGTASGQVIGMGYAAYAGKEQVASAYAELQAPLAESLELSGAVRVDKYRDIDATAIPKLGAKWKPTHWLALRASYAGGVRAPSPVESGSGGLVSGGLGFDPVRCPDPAAGGPNCALLQFALIGSPSRDLKPEKARSYTAGLILQPTPTTSLTLDAFRIERRHEILIGDTEDAIRENGEGVLRDGDDLPGIPHSGTLLAVRVDYVNADSTIVQGFDLDARQEFEVGGAGSLTLGLQWTRMNSFERDVAGVTTEYAGTHGDCNITNCVGIPKHRANLDATLALGRWRVSGIVNYRGALRNTDGRTQRVLRADGSVGSAPAECASRFADGRDAPDGCELPAFYTLDLSANWKATQALELFGSVANATDRIAPLDPLTYGAVNFNPTDYSGALGRYFTFGMRYAFR
jgi:iron complex outermembrane receptor protein